MEKKNESILCDRISALPDSLIHLIFSYLDVSQVVQTSVLSKRWKSLWISNPYLNIRFDEWLGYDDGDYSWINGNFDGDEFKKFVDRVLLLRDDSSIHKFSLECQCYDDRDYEGADQIGFCDWQLDQMDIWISSVIRRNVQEVKLHSLEISLSTLKSLLAQVKSLTLDAVRFELENSSESDEILMSSNVLEHLKLKDCDCSSYRKLTISAPNLKKLMVIDVANDDDGGTGSSVIKICAQNLKGYYDRDYEGADQIGFCDWGLDQVDIWITSVIRRKIQEVKLQSLEISLSGLKSLLAQVKSLKLVAVRFELGDSSESNEILMSSNVLEHLELKYCGYRSFKKLTISAPNLKKLMVIDYGEDTRSRVIKICAQNLKVLQIKGHIYEDYVLENLESLESAEINIDIDTGTGEDFARCSANILKGLYNTKSLILSADLFQEYAEAPNVLNGIALSFRNMRCLKFTNWRAKGCMSAIVKLLEKFTNLETLVMAVKAETPMFFKEKVEEWGAHLLSPHLKYIEIQEPESCENGFKFLKYLLKNAAGLEKIVMMAATSTQASETEKLLEFCKRLQVLPKASSRVKISLIHKFLSP